LARGSMKDRPEKREGLIHRLPERGRRPEAGLARSAVDRRNPYSAPADPEALLRLILGLSTNFIVLPPDDVDDGIRDVLKAIGSFAVVDRSCVFQFRDNGNLMSRTHEWCAHGVESQMLKTPLISTASLPWFCKKIGNYEVVHVPDVTRLPAEAAVEKLVFLSQGIRSLVAVPIVSADAVIGFIGFESLRLTETFSENAIALLKVVGEIFAFALSRKQVMEALRQSESKYKVLFEHASDAIFLVKGGMFVDCNTKTLTMFGCERAQILGHSAFEFSPDVQPNGDDSRQGIMEKGELALAGKPQFFEWKYLRPDGTLFDAEVSFNRVDIGNEVFLQAIVRDITDRKQAAEKLEKTLENLRQTNAATVQVMAHVVETRDAYTAGHQRRVAGIAVAIAEEMGLSFHTIEGIRMAGVIHDIGKISIPAEILSKPGDLRKKEFELIKDHPQMGYEILKDVEFPWPIAEIVHQHHERMDGSGYPGGLSGNKILLEARIIAVSDVVEAIASHRPYRPARGIDVALSEIEANRGVLYDGDVVDACLHLFRERGYKIY